MNKIKCPKCKETFEIDETSYAAILQQVRTEEFNNEIDSRLKIEKDKFNSDLQLEKKDNEKKRIEEVKIISDDYKTKLNNKDETIRIREEEIKRIKEMRNQLSTKMVGETLEQHCENEFNKVRALGFQKSYFKKDNDASSGSKGDYIFKDYDENGIEIISIMFEMKNESDTTATKKKNEDFYKELDKDRNEKKCEYAVLVSLLEQNNELFNSGIVDVSHEFQKMYVIRPQFFIPMITLLRNAALNSLSYKNELALIKEQNIDINNFEADLNNFKTTFGKSVILWDKQSENAIKQIDKSIEAMNKIKNELLSAKTKLKHANTKASAMSIKKLTSKNQTMKNKFKELNKE